MENLLDINKIMELLPHRYPLLLVDRVIEMEPDKRIVAVKNVSINEPFFQGHFPGLPIMPGVLIVEAMAQAGGVLVLGSLEEGTERDAVYFMGIDKARFRKPVVPGDQLRLEVEITKKRSQVVKLSGTASVDGALVAEAQLMATFGD